MNSLLMQMLQGSEQGEQRHTLFLDMADTDLHLCLSFYN